MTSKFHKNWSSIAIALGNRVPQRKARKAAGTDRQLELHVPPKPRYAVPDHIAVNAWKKLRQRQSAE